jgi:hypothetical protein
MSMGDMYQRITGCVPTAAQTRRLERAKTILNLSHNDAMLPLLVVQDWYLEKQLTVLNDVDKRTGKMAEMLGGQVGDRLNQFEAEILNRIKGNYVIDKWFIGFYLSTVISFLVVFAVFIFKYR